MLRGMAAVLTAYLFKYKVSNVLSEKAHFYLSFIGKFWF